jgi:hypothetical protein
MASATETTSKVGVNPENKPAATVASGLAALGTVLAAAGITEGVVSRMAREEGVLFGIAIGATLVAGLFGVFAALFANKRRWERWLLIASNLVLLAGFIFGAIGAIRVWDSTRVPTLTAAPEITPTATFLNVTVKGSGLDSREHVALLVEPLRAGHDGLIPAGHPLYTASLGSDDDGKVDQVIKVRLPDGFNGYIGTRAFTGALPKGCYADGESDGCISSKLIVVPERPQLKATWGSHGTRLRVLLKAQQIYGQTMSLRVLGRRGSKWHEIAHWRLAPSSAGSFARGYTVRKVKRWNAVCIVASTSNAKRCPPRPQDARSVWARYRVPSS